MNALYAAIKELEKQRDELLDMATEASDEDYTAILAKYNEVVDKLNSFRRVAGFK